MHIFFRDEMVVKDSGLTTPAHHKQLLLIDLPHKRPAAVVVSEFEIMDWKRWTAVRDSDMVSAVHSGHPHDGDNPLTAVLEG
ncbi:MAG: hypothetical protein VXZ82_08175 [Planctomycetota bacterium]|nr:hypothetical protein [Planctomycetota bacterium]